MGLWSDEGRQWTGRRGPQDAEHGLRITSLVASRFSTALAQSATPVSPKAHD